MAGVKGMPIYPKKKTPGPNVKEKRKAGTRAGLTKPAIAAAAKAWNMDELINVIEINVGKDLQYIRFNGTLIAGLAGLLLHAGEMLLRMA